MVYIAKLTQTAETHWNETAYQRVRNIKGHKIQQADSLEFTTLEREIRQIYT